MKIRTRLPIAASLAAALAVTTSVAATAAPTSDDYSEVLSEAGIPAVQIAPSDLSDAELEQAIRDYEAQQVPKSAQPSDISPLATGQYVTYCEEGSSGLMPWTNNSAVYCYGNYYEYLDGVRMSKVNMIRLKAFDESLNPAPEVALKEWCDNNGTYCFLATTALGYGGKFLQVGKYLKALLG